MALELRPSWTWSDDDTLDAIEFGAWQADNGVDAFELDGDSWKPGTAIQLTRQIQLSSEATDLDVQSIAIAARWSSRSTASAGVHVGGPEPLALNDSMKLELHLPASIAVDAEIETCLVSRSNETAAPLGALLWSDGWSASRADRMITLEGSATRIPVRTVRFSERFETASSALWTIHVEPSVELGEPIGNVCSVFLNEEVLQREFQDSDGEPDASRLPDYVSTGIQVDLMRSLVRALLTDLQELEPGALNDQDGSIGAMLTARLTEAFGSVSAGVNSLEDDPSAFDRRLWSRFAPNRWSGGLK